MSGRALLVGNSDGIGLATTRALLNSGWKVTGISRSESPLRDPAYTHMVCSVQTKEYPALLKVMVAADEPIDLCIYCAGIGELLDLENMSREATILEVNLLGMVKTAASVLPRMVERGQGHFIGLSSVADELWSDKAPSYHASKAGFSNYLEGLALALKPRGVHVSNVRFGFVDTKLARGKVRPFMMDVDRAAGHLLTVLEKKPIRYTAPRLVIPLVKFRRLLMGTKVRFGWG